MQAYVEVVRPLEAAILRNVVSPWDKNPYLPLSWWEMEKFAAAEFYQVLQTIAKLTTAADTEFEQGLKVLNADASTCVWIAEQAEELGNRCFFLGLKTAQKAAKSVVNLLKKEEVTTDDFRERMRQLENIVSWEMEEVSFFYLPSVRADYYDQKELFGVSAIAKFPAIQYDMVEAGNCYAMGRGTACVFHLMRVMEIGVQKFGGKLGVTFSDAKNWQNILDEANKAIKILPPKDVATKSISEVSANLYAVKLAWRNEVMHPNDTYTLEEAENLIRQVKIFMGQLAKIL